MLMYVIIRLKYCDRIRPTLTELKLRIYFVDFLDEWFFYVNLPIDKVVLAIHYTNTLIWMCSLLLTHKYTTN